MRILLSCLVSGTAAFFIRPQASYKSLYMSSAPEEDPMKQYDAQMRAMTAAAASAPPTPAVSTPPAATAPPQPATETPIMPKAPMNAPASYNSQVQYTSNPPPPPVTKKPFPTKLETFKPGFSNPFLDTNANAVSTETLRQDDGPIVNPFAAKKKAPSNVKASSTFQNPFLNKKEEKKVDSNDNNLMSKFVNPFLKQDEPAKAEPKAVEAPAPSSYFPTGNIPTRKVDEPKAVDAPAPLPPPPLRTPKAEVKPVATDTPKPAPSSYFPTGNIPSRKTEDKNKPAAPPAPATLPTNDDKTEVTTYEDSPMERFAFAAEATSITTVITSLLLLLFTQYQIPKFLASFQKPPNDQLFQTRLAVQQMEAQEKVATRQRYFQEQLLLKARLYDTTDRLRDLEDTSSTTKLSRDEYYRQVNDLYGRIQDVQTKIKALDQAMVNLEKWKINTVMFLASKEILANNT